MNIFFFSYRPLKAQSSLLSVLLHTWCVRSRRISYISPALYGAAPGKSSFSSTICCSSRSTSAAACGCDLVQMINPSLCLVVSQDHLWFSVFSGAQDGAHQQNIYPFLGVNLSVKANVEDGASMFFMARILEGSSGLFLFLLIPNMITFPGCTRWKHDHR